MPREVAKRCGRAAVAKTLRADGLIVNGATQTAAGRNEVAKMQNMALTEPRVNATVAKLVESEQETVEVVVIDRRRECVALEDLAGLVAAREVRL